MSAHDISFALDSQPRFSAATLEALLHAAIAVVVVILAVSAFAVNTVFGAAATFAITGLIAVALPAAVPFLIVTAFLCQNMVVAWYSPMIPDNTTFDAMRGANFVILITAFATFMAAAFQARVRAIAPVRPWIVGGIALCAVVILYLGLGVAHGEAKDAIVYFRNTITPIACFYIAIIAASLYRIDLTRLLPWLAGFAIVYGYCELTFAMDFLSIFHGDQYIERDIWRQIQTGVWEKALQQTGFVLRGLQDVMMTDIFNLPVFSGIFPKVFRIGGPAFHNISFAYSLAVMSVWLLFNKRWVLPILALPLLLVIGSKGAMIMLLFGLFVRIAAPLLGVRLVLILTTIGAVLWVVGSIAFGIRSGDYHVLGLFAGVRDFLENPLGAGLGLGGNLSSTSVNINWELAQAEGAAGTPMESAIGVMLYQMGIGSLAYFAFLLAAARASWRMYRTTGDFAVLFVYVAVITVSANAVLQEEAYYSPLALGLCLLLGGVTLGSHWNPFAARSAVARR
jgi:hypothetical protein